MTKISFIYFDVGGVAIKDFSDTNKWSEMIKYLGVRPDKEALFMKLYKQKDDDICLGLPIDQWLREIQDQVGIKIQDDFSYLNYFIDNFTVNSGLWRACKPYYGRVKMGLLTDQYPGMLAGIIQAKLLPDIKWESIIDSSVEKIRKPMPEIYTLAKLRAGVPDSEILFIENRENNLTPARDRGWQTFLYDSRDYDQANKDLSEYLKTITF